jgi:archaeal preflagellin peptidase FlaK
MFTLMYVFTPLVLFLGILTSYSDIKCGKIWNKHILIFFILALLAYISLYFFSVIKTNTIILTLINFGAGAIIGILCWFLGFWSAGDAKLFTLYLLIVPNSFYIYKSYTFLTLLINIIIPIAAYFISVMLLTTSIKEKWIFLKKYLNLKYVYTNILLIFSVGWVIQILLSFFKIPQNLLINIILIMGFAKLITTTWKKNPNLIYGAISIIRIILKYRDLLSINFWSSFLLFTVGYMIVRGIIFDMGAILFSKAVDTNDLKPGMILAENIVQAKKGELRKVNMDGFFSTSQIQNKDFLLSNTIEGITKKDILILKKYSISSIRIQPTIPFAPFMFLGALIILLSGRDIVSLVGILF